MSEIAAYTLTLNPAARVDLRQVGAEQNPLLVVDEVLLNPEDLIAVAGHSTFSQPQHTRYPGLNAPAPLDYTQGLIAQLRPILHRAFGIPARDPVQFFSFFGLATEAPEALDPIQKVPHHDSPDPFRIAMVHYLCHPSADGSVGGTAFFRHRATGFEGVDARRRPDYVASARAELDAIGHGLTRHVSGDTPNYEMIDFCPLAFNRLVVYRSHVLHSGLLEGAALSPDPRIGRLTINSFVEPDRAKLRF